MIDIMSLVILVWEMQTSLICGLQIVWTNVIPPNIATEQTTQTGKHLIEPNLHPI